MKNLTLVLLFSLLVSVSMAATFTSAATGNWSDPTKWTFTGTDADGIPDADDDATIGATHTITLTANAAINNLTLLGTTTTRLAMGNFTLEINGTINGPNTSFTNNILTTGTSGRLKFVGNSRALFGTNWAAHYFGWRCEIALNSGQTGTASTNVKIGYLLVLSGTFQVGSTTATKDLRIDGLNANGTGDIYIAPGATLIGTGYVGTRTSTATTYCNNIDINGTLIMQGSRLNGYVNVYNGGMLIIKRITNVAGLVSDPQSVVSPNFSYSAGSILQYDLEGTVGRMPTGAEINQATGPRYIDNLVLNNSNGINIQSSPRIVNKLKIIAGDIITSTGQAISYSATGILHYNGSIAQTTGTLDIPAANGPNDLMIENAAGVTYNYTTARSLAGNLNITTGSVFKIAPLAQFTLSGTLTNPGGIAGLVIKSDATGSGSFINSTTGVSGSMETYISLSKWHFISSPLTNAVSGLFTNFYLQSHNETSNTYSDIIPTTTPLNIMQGYALWSGIDTTFTYEGPFNAGAQSFSLTRNSLGWNLTGNPYPSSIDWDAASGWTKTNVNDAIYVENNGGWATYIAGSGVNGGSRYIAPGQGFFVNCNTNPGTLGMTDAVRAHNNTTFFKNEVTNMVRLQATGNNYNDEAIVRFMEEATATFDGMYDAFKLAGDVNIPEIYSMAGSDELAINALPVTEMVQLGFRTQNSGTYTLAATEVLDITNVILEDKNTGTFTDLNQSSYSFDYEAGENANRFALHFTPLVVGEPKEDMFHVYSAGKLVYFNLKNDEKAQVSIFNLLGQEVKSGMVNRDNNSIRINEGGIYLVRVTSEGKSVTAKVNIN